MSRIFIKLIAAAVSLVLLGASMVSCGVFTEEEGNFVGLNNIIEYIYRE